jgi:tetratricopeptide (TPR) repeat protein
MPEEEAASIVERARTAKQAGRLDEALQLFSDVIGRNPKFGSPGVLFSERGEVYQSLQRLDDALDDYTRALKATEHRDLYLRRINVASALGRADLVKRDLMVLMRRYPNDPQVLQMAAHLSGVGV